MPKQDLTNLQQTLEQGKLAKAKKIISDFFKSKWSDQDKAAAHYSLASTYVSVNNSLGRLYKQTLDDAIGILRNIKSAQARTNDKIRVHQLKGKIKNI